MAVCHARVDHIAGVRVLFASDYLNGEFLSGRTLTVLATFSDRAPAQATRIVPEQRSRRATAATS
jgi:hypothetical protein